MSVWSLAAVALACALACACLTAYEYALLRLRSTLSEELLARIRGSAGLQRRIAAAKPLVRAVHLGVFCAGSLFAWVLCAICLRAGAGWGACLGAACAAYAFYAFAFVVPRKAGAAFPIAVVRIAGAPMAAFRWILWPLLRPLAAFADFLEKRWNLSDAAALSSAADSVQKTSPTVRAILGNALDLHDLDVSDIMVPRNRVVYLDIDRPVAEQLDLAKKSGHTRFPLVSRDLDRCLGLIHIKDVFRSADTLDSLVRLRRDILRLPANELLDNALNKMLRDKQHMAIVADEFGGTAGIVTLDGIVEEIVGDIRDEFDSAPEVFIAPSEGGGAFRVSGLTPLHDLEERFDRSFSSPNASTLGGLITETLERLPQKGETVHLEGPNADVRVDETDGRRILWATLFLRA